IRNLSLSANSTAQIQFDITLQSSPYIGNGTVVTNQATLRLAGGTTFAWSDDPTVNGIAPDPTNSGAEDPTRVTIVSAAPTYQFDKTVQDLTSPANPSETAAPGDKLRYTLRFRTTS